MGTVLTTLDLKGLEMKKQKLTLAALATVALAAGVVLAGAVPANANESRYYGARYCAGNVASHMRVNAVSWVDIYQVGGGVAGQTYYILDNIWRTYTFYSDVKNSSSQEQTTYNYFSTAYIFCDL
jgi:hypothetical protein